MPSAIEHAEIVFSAIIPKRSDLLDKAIIKLSEDHFVDDTHKSLFKILTHYHQTTSQVVPEHFIDDNVRSADPAKKILLIESHKAFAERVVDDSEFIWAVEQLRELASYRDTLSAVNESVVIMRQGKTLQDGTTLLGAWDARDFLSSEFSAIDKSLKLQASPEGDMRDEMDAILDDYAERKQSRLDGKSEGIRMGIPSVDEKVGGFQNGELILVAGYTSDGKSTLVVQAAWSACVEQGKNVLFLTTETLRPQINRKLVARHSKLPMFEIPEGLNTRDIKAGTLPQNLEEKYFEVVRELATNPSYGRMYVAQVPRSSSITSIEQTMYRVQKRFHIDFVVMDYLALLRSDKKRGTNREELAEIMKEAKQVATTFDDGRGVPFMSPWQVSRLARENAEKIGMYTSASLSETAEATNSADVILSLLAPSDNTNRNAEVTMQVLKNRDGETANNIIVEVDYATSSFKGREAFKTAAGSSFSGGIDSVWN